MYRCQVCNMVSSQLPPKPDGRPTFFSGRHGLATNNILNRMHCRRSGQPRYTHCIYRLIKAHRQVCIAINIAGNEVMEQREYLQKEISREITVCEECYHSIHTDEIFREAVELKMRAGLPIPMRDMSAPPYRNGRATVKETVEHVFIGTPTEHKTPAVVHAVVVGKPVIMGHPVKPVKSNQ